jgi:DNA invertase Pin-like site-specific DNA recombinase
MSGAVADRPQLVEALKYTRKGDTLVVWKLDRLARSVYYVPAQGGYSAPETRH